MQKVYKAPIRSRSPVGERVGRRGRCIAASGLRSVMARGAAEVRMQLDQRALNALPGDERLGLEMTAANSPAAQF